MTAESFPCIICGRRLMRDMDEYEAQPRDGVMCETEGNYGSTVFDSCYRGEMLHFNICDDCLTDRGQRGWVMIRQATIQVRAPMPFVRGDGSLAALDSVVGWKRVDRPFVKWNPRMRDSDEHESLTLDEVIARYDRDDYRWTVDKEHFVLARNELLAGEDQ